MYKELEDVHCYKMVVHLGWLGDDTDISGVISEDRVNDLIKQGKLLEPTVVNFHHKDCPIFGTKNSHSDKESYRFLVVNLNDLKQ